MLKANMLAVILILIIIYFAENIIFSKQLLLLDSLKQISSIVLAITGAWAAIIYPDSLKNLMKKEKNYPEEMKKIQTLLEPMKMSIIILSIIVFIEISGFILKLFTIPSEYIPYLRDISLFIIIYLYFLQIITLFKTYIPIHNALNDAKTENKVNTHMDTIINRT